MLLNKKTFQPFEIKLWLPVEPQECPGHAAITCFDKIEANIGPVDPQQVQARPKFKGWQVIENPGAGGGKPTQAAARPNGRAVPVAKRQGILGNRTGR